MASFVENVNKLAEGLPAGGIQEIVNSIAGINQAVIDSAESVSTAEAQANIATDKAAEALANETKAKKWADEAEDIEVETGKYSARHWSIKAEELVVSGVIDDVTNSLIKTYSSTKINADLSAHTNNTTNPHSVTKTQVGLGDVNNTSDANKPVSTAQQTALDGKLGLTGGTMNGAITALRETKVAMGANDIDLATGNVFTKTITTTTTLTVSNVLASGNANSFILELTNGGAYAITYPLGSKFAGGIAFTLTASGKDILGCYSHDGGTTLNWIILGKDVK